MGTTLPEPTTTNSQLGTDLTFPTRPTGERTLSGAVMAWAAANGGSPPSLRSKEDTFRHVLHVGQQHLDVRSQTWRNFSAHVVREYHGDITGEPLGGDTERGQMSANRLLYRLIGQHGALNTLRLIATALESGAGLDPAYEGDALAVLRYASAIGRREQSEWGRR